MTSEIEAYIKKQGARLQNRVYQNGHQNQEDLEVKREGTNIAHFKRSLFTLSRREVGVLQIQKI